MRAAAVRGGALGEILKIPTPQDPEEGLKELIRLAHEAAQGETISAVCVGFASTIVNNSPYHPTNKKQWHAFPLTKRLQKELNASTAIFNDAALAGLGEAHYGAGKGSKILAYVTVSTGVGGVRVVDGIIDPTTYGFEMGHHIINTGIFHNISGPAAKERYGVEPWDLPEAARRELADELTTGLYNTTLFWSPDTIVLGGSMITGKNPIPIDSIEVELTKRLANDYPTGPSIKKAALGDHSGLYGAMAYLAPRG